jgi:MarR family transcriptional regulator, negative regulator of the multidrug operon emrRAB
MARSAQLLERLGALVQQAVRDDAARHGLLPVQLQVLAYLAQANNYSDLPVAVAEYLGITRGTVSQTIAVLERDGLLTKHADDEHGRRIHLRLTKNGERIVAGAWSQRLHNALTESHVHPTELEHQLSTLLVALQRHNDQQSFGVCHDCAYFQTTSTGKQCGLTGEPLAKAQTVKICREWMTPEQTLGE